MSGDDTRLVAGALGEVFEGVFDSLEDLVGETVRLLVTPTTSADLARLDPVAIRLVQHSELVVGAGYVARPGALTDTGYWLQWWADYDIPRTRHPQRLQVELDPGSDLFREYTELPWFAVPARSGRRHVTGPYVDYLCTDEDTLTFTVPVRAEGVFAGVVGADVYARDIERLALPCLKRLDAPAALVNASSRVVAAVKSPHVPGDLVRTAGSGGSQDPALPTIVPLPDVPFTIVIG